MKNCVRKLRREKEESQQALADSVGASRQAIINIEKERVIPNGALMLAIARHYGKDASEVFFDNFVTRGEQPQNSA
jgi:DNA-binding XRE family transcriptional regulator